MRRRHFGEPLLSKEGSVTAHYASLTGVGTGQPGVHHVQDLASHLQEGEDTFATGFVVHQESWCEKTFA